MIAILVPVLNRPKRVHYVISNVKDHTTVPYRLLFLASPGDTAEIQELEACGADYLVVPWQPGRADWARKINYGLQHTDEPFIFTGADDLFFNDNWDIEALKFMETPQIGVVGTQDLCNERVKRGEHSTHSLIRRTYAENHGTIDGPGRILAECYPHEFVDDELVETARSRDAWAFADNSIVEHLHPNCGKSETDRLYRQAPRRLMEGRRIYRNRRPKWNPKTQSRTAPISVIVASYGDDWWQELAVSRAIPSANNQRTTGAAEVIAHHGDSLAEARNQGAKMASSPWLCFLDADDELSSNYIHAMSRFLNSRGAGLLNPAVQFVIEGKPKPPKSFQPRDLRHGNYLVIGTVIKADLFWEAGGFDTKWEAWEDWALFRRIVGLGGRIVRVPQAVYKAHWNQEGRNNTVPDPEGLRDRICQDYDEWERNRSR